MLARLCGDEVGHSGSKKITWVQSIGNEKLATFAEGTRVARARWNKLEFEISSVLLAKIARKVWVKYG